MGHKIQMYENLLDMLDREIGEIERKRDLDEKSLDNLFKLTSSLKAVDKHLMLLNKEEGSEMKGYSQARYRYANSMDNMGANAPNGGASMDYSMDGQSMARRGRDGDGDGRYNESHDNFRYSTNRGGSYDQGNSYEYSRDNARKKMVQKLETLMDDTMSDNERQAIKECISKIK